MSKMQYFLDAARYTYREDGWRSVVEKTRNNLREVIALRRSSDAPDNSFFDVMFVNGCDYSVPHPVRYRVGHQVEQLRAAGLSCGVVDAWNLRDDHLRHARTFIFFRCPVTDEVERFIGEAKRLNKRVLYDIDDLVFDTCYTDAIPYVQSLTGDDRVLYDEGVVRMGKTLSLCEGAITTTEALAEELARYVPLVFVNRNTASDDMLMLSNDAVFRRDELPLYEESKLCKGDRKKHSLAVKRRYERQGVVKMGYFSGSITHNADFEIIMRAVAAVMKARDNVKLVLVGELDVPIELESLRDRIEFVPFCDWKRLPYLIAGVDINLAPLQDTLFNRAKSENKWVEASLVKVVTVASNVGAFSRMIEHDETGVLCGSEEDWERELLRLVDSADDRERIAANAHAYCVRYCTTINTGHRVADFIRAHQTPNIAMVMPSLNTSGGVLVVLKHGAMLQEAGYDVLFVNTDDTLEWADFEGRRFPVLNRCVPSGMLDRCPFSGRIDNGVATLWDTLDFLRRYPNVGKKSYIVQNFETDFYEPGDPLRQHANATYAARYDDVVYLTISPWCSEWLKQEYGVVPRFAPNGIDVERFYSQKRDFQDRRCRILIEGDCGSEYKNVDESFEITNRLDSEKFEIWYMSYTGTTKPFYRIDRNLGAVAHEEVGDVYRQCDILLKTSILESFSYPPLEMMATGGYVVAVPNGGNSEYLVHEENCLLYSAGKIDDAIAAIHRIYDDRELRDSLYEGGIATARARDWTSIKEQVLDLYR